MAKQIGSQYRETLEESGMEVYQGPNEDGEILLTDDEGNIEVWFQHDDHAGYTIEIDGMGYEFVRSYAQDVFDSMEKFMLSRMA